MPATPAPITIQSTGVEDDAIPAATQMRTEQRVIAIHDTGKSLGKEDEALRTRREKAKPEHDTSNQTLKLIRI
jgi:hypothetical protein